MTHAEVSPSHNPLEDLGQRIKAIPPWAGRHWKSLSLVVAALGTAGIVTWLITHDRGPQSSSGTPTKASDTLKPPKDESGIALVPLATSTPEVTPQPPATSTPEATPTPKPENPLPSYSVFSGNAIDEKGAKVAEVVMASIPQPAGPDQIFMYYITTKNSKGERGHSASQLKPTKVDGTHFEIGGYSSPKINLPPRMTADFNQKEMTITGTDVDICLPGNTPCNTKFTLKSVGQGKQAIFGAMQTVINDLSSDQPTTPQKELDFYLPLYNKWP